MLLIAEKNAATSPSCCLGSKYFIHIFINVTTSYYMFPDVFSRVGELIKVKIYSILYCTFYGSSYSFIIIFAKKFTLMCSLLVSYKCIRMNY